MNTKASVAYGWGILVLAGGGSYYFAKRSINSDRADRAARIEEERQLLQKMRESEHAPKSTVKPDASAESAPKETGFKSKYAAAEPFRSRKGDRFS